jgi:hypothetical protein
MWFADLYLLTHTLFILYLVEKGRKNNLSVRPIWCVSRCSKFILHRSLPCCSRSSLFLTFLSIVAWLRLFGPFQSVADFLHNFLLLCDLKLLLSQTRAIWRGRFHVEILLRNICNFEDMELVIIHVSDP